MSNKPVSGARPELVLFTGHSDTVHRLAFSTDGGTLASCSHDGSVILWDAQSLKITQKLSISADVVIFSPCGSLLAAFGYPKARLFDVRTSNTLFALPDVRDVLGFLPDGKLLAISLDDDLVHFDQQGRVVERKPWGSAMNHMSADGTLLARLLYDDSELTMWDTETGHRLFSVETPEGPGEEDLRGIEDLVFSPDSRVIACVGRNSVLFFGTQDGQLLYASCKASFPSVAFSHDSANVAMSWYGCPLEVINTRTWQPESGGEIDGRWLGKTFSPDGTVLASVGDDRVIRMWDAATGTQLRQSVAHTLSAVRVEFSDDSTGAEAAYADPGLFESEVNRVELRTWDTATGKPGLPTAPFDLPEEPIAVSPDGSIAVVRRDEGRRGWLAAVVRTDSGEKIDAVATDLAQPPNYGDFSTAAFSPNGKLLCIGQWSFGASLWDTNTWRKRGVLRRIGDAVLAVVFSPDGKTVAVSTCYDSTVQLFSVKTLREKRRLTEHTSRVESIAFSPDGRILATASADGTVRLWNPRNGLLLVTLLLFSSGEGESCDQWISFTPEGYYNASPEAEHFIRWKVGGEILPGETFALEFRRTDLHVGG
jgi:WD40 repeat protein